MEVTETTVHDITNVHGARTTSEALRIYDAGMTAGDTILCHQHYRLRFNTQTRAEFYQEALGIQSYVCLIQP